MPPSVGAWTAARSHRRSQASKYSCVQLGRRLGDQVADQNNSPRIVTWEIEMARGTVKWFNPTKGYGFIQPQGGGKDVFVHISAVERAGLSTLNEGQQIEFEIEENRGKTSAVNLKVK
jgi:cold shock protein